MTDPFYRVGDFWNDPRRWDGIPDPTKECFWSKRRADVIDVRKPKSQWCGRDVDPIEGLELALQEAGRSLQNAANPYMGQMAMMQQSPLNGYGNSFGPSAYRGLFGLGL